MANANFNSEVTQMLSQRSLALMPPVIAIDGPSASGKGTVAELVAEQLGFNYLDSGALYRIIALAALNNQIAWHEEVALVALAQTLNIQFKNNQILLNDADVSELVRSENIGRGASEVAVHPLLRTQLLALQRSFRKAPGLVSDGRDMATVIFTDAVLKVFLTADVAIRAERRYKQLIDRGQAADFDAILFDLKLRDERDSGRSVAPLTQALDAHLLNTDHLSIAGAVQQVVRWYKTTGSMTSSFA